APAVTRVTEIAIRKFSGHADIYWPQYARSAGTCRTRGRLRTLLETLLLVSPEDLGNDTGHLCRWMDRFHDRPCFFPRYTITSSPSNPIFVSTVSSLVEIVQALICNEPGTLHALNSKNFNCAQVAAQLDEPLAICSILKESRKLHVPLDYTKSAMQAAAQAGRPAALKAILAIAGPGFVVLKDFLEFAEEPWKSYDLPLCEEICVQFLVNNNALGDNETLWTTAVRNEKYGLTIVQTLLQFARHINLTRSLISVAKRNRHSGLHILFAILAAKNEIRLDFDVRDVISEYGFNIWFSEGLEGSKTQKSLSTANMAILNRAVAVEIYKDSLLNNVLSQNPSKVELRWDHLVAFKKMYQGQDCLLLLLDGNPEMDDPAVNMILSQWDEKVVAALLEIREVAITDEVIKTVAGNMRSGAKIMELLLKREAEMMDLLN
ncbi:hypothetical protein IFR04_012747, partial [Cadophora malorum]